MTQTFSPGTTTRRPHCLEKGDHMITTERVATYDRMARNLHHPHYRNDFSKHYDDLFRANLKFYDLNYPAPPPEIRTRKHKQLDPLTGTMSTTMYSTRYASTDTRRKSKYMSTRTLSQRKTHKSFADEFVERLKQNEGAPFADQEKIVADIVKALLKGDVDMDTIQAAFENVHVEFIVHQDTSELEIDVHF